MSTCCKHSFCSAVHYFPITSKQLISHTHSGVQSFQGVTRYILSTHFDKANIFIFRCLCNTIFHKLLPTCGLSVYIMFRNMFTPCFKPCLHTVWRYFYIRFKDLYAKCLNKYLYNVWKHVCIKFENMFASGNSCFNTTLLRISGHVYTLFENILTNFTYIFYIGPHVRLRLVAVLF